jgi:sulfofructose kinase
MTEGGKRWDVLGLGVVAVDDLLFVEHYPGPDVKLPVLSRKRQGGGLAGTALVAAQRLGARAAYLGVLGEDDLSLFTLKELEREGVDCSACLRREGARPFYAVIIVDQFAGTRNIFYTSDSVIEPPIEALSEDLLCTSRLLFADYSVIGSGMHALRSARKLGMPTVADLEVTDDPRVPEFISLVDHLIIGLQAGKRFTGEIEPEAMVRALSKGSRRCTTVTAGQRGCWYAEAGGPIRHFPAFDVRVVDTTGCGDVFHGAYMACIAKGETVERAIQVATTAAGIKAGQPGGRMGIPSMPAVEQFLSAHGF